MSGQKVLPANTARPETKVTAASVATYLGSVAILAIVNAAGQVDYATALPSGWAQVLLLPVIPGVLAAISGWAAPHTKRIGRGMDSVVE